MGTPQLNIKDAEATRLARELAELTGESQTEAVRTALRERLEREKTEREKTERESHAVYSAERKRRDVENTLAEIKKIQEEIRRTGLIENMLTDDDLYDEHGLPK
jgi:antitoxin VapB